MADGGNDEGNDDVRRGDHLDRPHDHSDRLQDDPDRLQSDPDRLQDPTDCLHDDLRDHLDCLHDHLAATEEVPVERDAGHWLGEAQALVGDLRARDAAPETVGDRLETVTGLLDEAAPTGNAEADEHVAAARQLAAELIAEIRLESGSNSG